MRRLKCVMSHSLNLLNTESNNRPLARKHLGHEEKGKLHSILSSEGAIREPLRKVKSQDGNFLSNLP